MQLPFRIIKAASQAWLDDRAPSMGAAIAYYTIFSLAPLLWLVTAIVGLVFGEATARGAIEHVLQRVMGGEAAQALQGMIQLSGATASSPLATAVSLVMLVVASTGMLWEIQLSFDVIWKVRGEHASGIRPATKRFLLSFALIVALGLILILSLAVNAALALVNQQFGTPIPRLLEVVNAVVSLSAMATILTLTFKLFSSAAVRWREAWIGAAVTSVLLEIGKYAIGLYVLSIAEHSFYRAAGAAAVLLIWAYYSSQILLFGAEITKAITDWRARRRGRRRAKPVAQQP